MRAGGEIGHGSPWRGSEGTGLVRGILGCRTGSAFRSPPYQNRKILHYKRIFTDIPQKSHRKPILESLMLLYFEQTNFKSFANMAAINLAARNAEKMINGATIPVDLPGSGIEKILASVAIYGANASGKTNLIAGLAAMDTAVLDSQTKWKRDESIPIEPHVLQSNSPTKMEIQILHDSIRYRYGFKCTKDRFLSEWLYSYPVGRERMLFQRKWESENGEASFEFGPSLSSDKRTLDSIKSRVRNNSLFISAGAQDNQLECTLISDWFQKTLRYGDMDIDYGTRTETSIFAHSFPIFKKLLIPLMKLADPAIEDVVVNFDGTHEEARDILGDYEKCWKEESRFEIIFKMCDGEVCADLPFSYQSRGVKKLYDLASLIINSLAFGYTVVIDELEASMHPHIAAKILALYQSRSSNPKGAQLIFTTHESRLLNLEHLRRDQVWFCEREGLGSELYALSEFSPRRDENLELGYLSGRYGAVPKAIVDPEWISQIGIISKAIRESRN